MNTRIAMVLLLLVVTPVLAQEAAPQGHHAHDATVKHGFEDVEHWVQVFDAPDRDEWQKPAIVVRVAGIEEGSTVADLGAGTGYFTRVLSRAVGARGTVYAVDIEPKLLAYIDGRKDLGDARVVTVLGEPADPKLPRGELDTILVVDTWHHIDARLEYLKKLEAALSPTGRVVIIDWGEGDNPVGPPPGARLSRDAVVEEFTQSGWSLATESVALPYQYFLVFYPPGVR